MTEEPTQDIQSQLREIPFSQELRAPANTQHLIQPRDPSQTDWALKRMERLEAEIATPAFQYANPATIRQLRQMVAVGGIFPANARNLIRERARILHNENFPPELFQIRRADLPVQTGPDHLVYSPLDYLASSMPGATLFPLKAIQRMQYTRERNKTHDEDPLTLREKYRTGLMQVITKLNPNSYDVKTLRGVSSPHDIAEIIETATACFGDPAKEEMFIQVLTNQFRIKIDTYNRAIRAKTGNPEAESFTSQELEELIHPENIRYLMKRIAETSGKWVEARKAPAEVLPIRPNLQFYADLIKRNPFWFARLSAEEIKKRCMELEALLEENVGDQTWAVMTTNAKYYLKDKRPTRYDPYLSRPFTAIAEERVEQEIRQLVETSEDMFRDALQGGTYVPGMAGLIDAISEAVKEMMDKMQEKVRQKKAEKTGAVETNEEAEAAAEQAEEKNDDNILYFPEQGRQKNTPPKELGWQLAKLTELTALVSRSVSPELIGRFHNILRRILEAQINEMVSNAKNGTKTMHTGDIYAAGKETQKLYPMFRLFSRIHGEQKARQLIDSVIEEKLGTLTDDEFAKLYADMFNNTAMQGRQTFSQFILPPEFVAPGTDKMMIPNRLPVARRRLLGMLIQRPELFHENFVKMGLAQFKKENTEN